MRAHDDMRPEQGLRVTLRVGAILAAVLAAGCAGENLFPTFFVTSSGLLGPQVDITAPQPNISIAPGDSVQVTATLTSGEGITEVSFSGTLDAGGAAPFTPVVVPLSAVPDTTMSRYLKRTPASPAGGAKIIVTAKDVSGDTGADTISVTLGG